MKSIYLVFIAILFFSTCKKDCVEYQDVSVDFFTEHPELKVIPTMFEEVTEQVLVKPVHNEGATFETVSETVVSKSSYVKYIVSEVHPTPMVVDAELNIIQEIQSEFFYDTMNFSDIEIPAEYKTISRQIVKVNGTGPIVIAEYLTLSKLVIEVPTSVELNPITNRDFIRVNFHIPTDTNIRTYIKEQFTNASDDDCVEGVSYRVVK